MITPEFRKRLQRLLEQGLPPIVEDLNGEPYEDGEDMIEVEDEEGRSFFVTLKQETETKTKRKFDPELGKRAVAAKKNLKQLAEVWIAQTLAADPEQYAGLKVIFEPQVRIKPTVKSGQIYDEIIDRILTLDGARSTHSEIIRKAEANNPSLAAPKDWTKPLPAWSLPKIRKRIAAKGEPYTSIAVDRATTLSSLHKQSRAVLSKTLGGEAFTVTVVVLDDRVLIDDVSFQITTTKAGDYKYKRVQIPMAKLLNFSGSSAPSRRNSGGKK